MTDFPRGWAKAPLSDLIAHDGIFTDGDWVESKDQDPNGSVRLIQLADIADSHFINKSSRFLTREKADELNCTFLKKGDLLVARMPDPLGRCCIFPLDGEERFVTVVDVCAIRLGSAAIERRYLMRAINSPEVRGKISALQSGSTRKRISRGNLATVPIPIPPLNEQRRIVEKIEAMFDEIDKGVESLQTARTTLGLHRQSLLKSAFEGRLTADWRAKNADILEAPENLLARIQAERDTRYKAALDAWQDALAKWRADGEKGKKPAKPKRPKDFIGSAKIPSGATVPVPAEWLIPAMSDLGQTTGGLTKNQKRNALPLKAKYLRVANVYSNRLELDEIMEIGVTEEELLKTSLIAGDLLFVEGNGSIEQIGRVAIWDGSIPNMTHQNHLIRFSSDGILSSRFALYFMMSPVGRKLIEAQASSTSGLHTLSISKIEGLPVPVCSPAEQTEIVRILDEKLEAADALEAEIDAALTRANALRQSILKKAFSGQLVPQDPDDEPAPALLERIKTDRAKAPCAKKRKTAHA
ncbi:restriction endonuclease subunit S [Paracoccus sanguinis]|nr:restriction endonuclease subunit S [Paracoccus sanguinis]